MDDFVFIPIMVDHVYFPGGDFICFKIPHSFMYLSVFV
jgi:hypothetical protein